LKKTNRLQDAFTAEVAKNAEKNRKLPPGYLQLKSPSSSDSSLRENSKKPKNAFIAACAETANRSSEVQLELLGVLSIWL
jgi:hypothetical protein